MQSKANIKGHPMHPILIVFPVAFFTATLLFDIGASVTGNSSYWRTAYHLEVLGIFTALLAAVPGIIDYFAVVPPASSAKRRATKHGLLNLSMTALFAIACLYRLQPGAIPGVIITVEALGFVLMGIAGWMGGTLVYRNQIGVSNRYADAGKWKEAQFSTSARMLKVATVDELKTNQLKLVVVNAQRIVIGKTEKGFVAFDDHCTHKGGSLAGGMLICGTVQCPWHGSQFNVTTGAATAGPAKTGITTYPLIEKDGGLYLSLA